METNLLKILRLNAIGLLLLIPLIAIASPKYYGKHIVLVVDQTPKTSDGGYLQPLGEDIKSFLFGTKPESLKFGPEDFAFDPETDYLEVFTYGLEGHVVNSNSAAHELWMESKNGNNNEALFQNTLNALVHPYEKYIGDGDFRQIWDGAFKKVFDADTPLGNSIRKNSGYGFSAFLPYAVLPFIDRTTPAQEYYVVSVSTFKTGTTGKIATYDIGVLSQIYGENEKIGTKAKGFDQWINDFAKPYQVSDWANFSLGSYDSGVSAVGNKLVLRSAVNTSVYITSNFQLSQKSYLGREYEMNKVAISFPKDKNLDISDIYLTVYAGNEVIYDETQRFHYDESRKEFIIDAQTLDLDKFSKDDILSFNFTFFPKYNAESGILPYVFLADRTLPANEIVYKPAPTYLYILIACFLAVLVLIFYYIYTKRGRKATAKINLNVWPISNSRFMDVTNNHVINQDCWYYQDGKRTQNIEVSGQIKPIYPSSAKRYKLVAEYQIQDVDLNEEFSFRPNGREPNGSFRTAKKWYPLAVDDKGNYSFEVTAYLEDEVTIPDFSDMTHCILRLSVLVRTYFVDKNGRQVTPYNQVEEKYRFIVRPTIENSDLWVALDPGTTGSCIAYGWGGLPADTNNINLACSMSTDTSGSQKLSHIFHSKIQILDNASIFSGCPAVDMSVFDSDMGKGDFRFGNEAHIFWGRNSFQSIKKLLGYANELEVRNSEGKVAKISGHDLAHLLIKGLCREFEKFLETSNSVADNVKQKLLTDGHLTPSRAIVAVPNNYTVNKVQAMVDTIKRTELFKEVHYLYEAEGVMMYYLNLNWSRLLKVENKTFIVFDMGGATINATAFKISVATGKQNGNVYTRSITVDTVSRVGYTVGGDNIDFALINVITGIPSFLSAIQHVSKSKDDFLKENKKRLISFVQRLKLDYIEKISAQPDKLREGNMAKTQDAFWTELFKFAQDCKLSIPDSISDNDVSYFKGGYAKEIMDSLVMKSVQDAIKELVSDIVITDVELILSGRSVLYPRIKKMVTDTLAKSKCKVSEWDYNGSNENSNEAVKTAVVRGACWYGMFSKYVRLRHDTVTSTFGYTDMVNQNVKFIPVVSKNTKFNENGEAENMVEPMDPTINTVKFIQMLGSEYDAIYNNPEALHKMAELKQVSSADIRNAVRTIKIKVDANGNFSYAIDIAGETEPLEGTCSAVDADITDTNSDAYAFAALTTLDDKYDNPVAGEPVSETPAETPKINIIKGNRSVHRF